MILLNRYFVIVKIMRDYFHHQANRTTLSAFIRDFLIEEYDLH